MRAQIIRSYGPPSVFELTDLPTPTVKPGHVLIRVHATSINQIDCKIRSGAVTGIGPELPAVLHGDVAGVIEALGADVTGFKIGDKVYGCAGGLKGLGGALATHMLADAQLIAKKPRNFTMEQAAALPLVGITAWDALFRKAQLQKGQHVLIHGGVGGVGHVAIQLAKYKGALVSTTVLQEEDVAIVRSLGADNVILAKQETVPQYVTRLTNGQGFDVVFDTVGGANLDASFQAAAIEGTVVTTAARSQHDLTPLHSKALHLHVVFMLLPLLRNVGRQAHQEVLNALRRVAEKKQLLPLVDKASFTLDTAAKAHAYVEAGRATGKVVISIPERN